MRDPQFVLSAILAGTIGVVVLLVILIRKWTAQFHSLASSILNEQRSDCGWGEVHDPLECELPKNVECVTLEIPEMTQSARMQANKCGHVFSVSLNGRDRRARSSKPQ